MLRAIFITFLLTSALWSVILYENKLSNSEKNTEMLDDIEKDFDEELLDKRTFRRHRDKLLKEKEELYELLSFIKQQAKENRIYRNYFFKNIKNDGGNRIDGEGILKSNE